MQPPAQGLIGHHLVGRGAIHREEGLLRGHHPLGERRELDGLGSLQLGPPGKAVACATTLLPFSAGAFPSTRGRSGSINSWVMSLPCESCRRCASCTTASGAANESGSVSR